METKPSSSICGHRSRGSGKRRAYVWPSQTRMRDACMWCMPGLHVGRARGLERSMGRGEHVGRGSMGRGSIGRGSMGSIGRVSIRRERACTGGRGGEGAWKEARGEGACGEGERWERERGERGSNMLSACEPRCGDSECLQFAPWPCELLQPATHSHAGGINPFPSTQK